MVFLYQIVIFSIIILSSFAGFGVLFLSILGTVIFTLIKVFTFELMAIQLTTIFIASIIGIIISTLRLFIDLPTIKKVLITLGHFIRNMIAAIKYFFKLSIVRVLRDGLIYGIVSIFRLLKYLIFNSKKILINSFEFIISKLWNFKESNIITASLRLIIIIAIRVLMGGILGIFLNIEVDSTFFLIILYIIGFLYLAYCVAVVAILPMETVGISYRMSWFIIILSFIAFIFGLEVVSSICETIL